MTAAVTAGAADNVLDDNIYTAGKIEIPEMPDDGPYGTQVAHFRLPLQAHDIGIFAR